MMQPKNKLPFEQTLSKNKKRYILIDVNKQKVNLDDLENVLYIENCCNNFPEAIELLRRLSSFLTHTSYDNLYDDQIGMNYSEEIKKLLEKVIMKKSEKLENKAAQENNDLKAFGLYNQALREKRVEKWDDKWKELIIASEKVLTFEDLLEVQGKITFLLEIKTIYLTSFTIDFYPKANKILIRKENKWIKPGLNWLIKNLL